MTDRDQEIRQLFAEETEATPGEARATLLDVISDPAHARRMITVVYALRNEDRDHRRLVATLELKLNRKRAQIEARAKLDDAFAIHAGRTIVAIMEQIKPGMLATLFLAELKMPPAA